MSKSSTTKQWSFRGFRGFNPPRYTMVPDEVFDVLLPYLSGSEVKVLLYICRRTFGFKKGSDRISKSQLENGITKSDGTALDGGTGLSRRAIRLALDSLVRKNILLKRQFFSKKRGHEATEFALNIIDHDPWVKNTQGVGAKSTQGLGTVVPTQYTDKQETEFKTVNGSSKSPIVRLPNLKQPRHKIDYIAHEIGIQLGDNHRSAKFYKLIAAKVPESFILQALAEIKSDGAESPPKLFTYKMNQYAVTRLRQGLVKDW